MFKIDGHCRCFPFIFRFLFTPFCCPVADILNVSNGNRCTVIATLTFRQTPVPNFRSYRRNFPVFEEHSMHFSPTIFVFLRHLIFSVFSSLTLPHTMVQNQFSDSLKKYIKMSDIYLTKTIIIIVIYLNLVLTVLCLSTERQRVVTAIAYIM